VSGLFFLGLLITLLLDGLKHLYKAFQYLQDGDHSPIENSTNIKSKFSLTSSPSFAPQGTSKFSPILT
jgi:hypothetical protein